MLDVGGDHMIGDDVRKEVKPEQGNLGEHPPFMRDAGRQDVVKGRNAVGGYEKKVLIIKVVNVAYLAAGVKFEVGEVSLEKDGIEKFGAHDEILQVRSVAYSSWSGNFVNGCDHCAGNEGYPTDPKNVDTELGQREGRLGPAFRGMVVVEKLRKGVDNRD